MEQTGMSDCIGISLLPSSGPAADRERGMFTYGRFVGMWKTNIIYWHANQPTRTAIGEWEFGYALEGRAVIDVWQVPPRAQAQRTGVTAECGLCVRIYDPALDLWRFTFHGPVSGVTINMIAQSVGSEIIQEYDDGGALVRWIFSDIQHDSFAWRAVRSTDGGSTWQVEQTVKAVRQIA
jgi:hypothetical protein